MAMKGFSPQPFFLISFAFLKCLAMGLAVVNSSNIFFGIRPGEPVMVTSKMPSPSRLGPMMQAVREWYALP